MNIGDIYAGKPDASDEIRECGYEEFANSYIKPSGINIARLASTEYGTPIFIMGDKGTGKTALLHFLQSHVQTIDASACTSFIFFDSGFSHVEREKFSIISKTISASIATIIALLPLGKIWNAILLMFGDGSFIKKLSLTMNILTVVCL